MTTHVHVHVREHMHISSLLAYVCPYWTIYRCPHMILICMYVLNRVKWLSLTSWGIDKEDKEARKTFGTLINYCVAVCLFLCLLIF